MLHAYSAAAVRAAEQPLLAAGRGPDLMRKAAHGLAMGVVAMLRSRGRGVYGASVVLLVGSGNNGGDALYAGAYLAARGARTAALLTSARTHPEALAAFVKAGGRCVPLGESGAPAGFLREAGKCDAVLDGLLGTGGSGGLREPAATVVAQLAKLSGPDRPAVVACDLPSGVDATTGEVHGPVLRADLTVTFGAHKTGLLSAPGEQFAGRVELVDLGIGRHLGQPESLRLDAGGHGSASAAAIRRRPQVHARRGRGRSPARHSIRAPHCWPWLRRRPAGRAWCAILARSRWRRPSMCAIPKWCVRAAPPMRCGCRPGSPGPALTGTPEQLDRAAAAIASGLPTVVDAAALALVGPDASGGNDRLVLTPHAGELSALLARCGASLGRARIEASPLAAACQAAELLGAVVLLKGPTTIVAAPDGRDLHAGQRHAPAGAAGSGDTLAGILVALLAMDCRSRWTWPGRRRSQQPCTASWRASTRTSP